MRSTSLWRACTTVLGTALAAAGLTAAAPPAAADCPATGPGVYGWPLSATVTTTAGAPGACYDTGSGPTAVWIDGGTMLTATPTFDCWLWREGSVGDPSDPPYVGFRVGIENFGAPEPTKLCVEVDGVRLTASFVPDGTPPRIVIEPATQSDASCYGWGYGADGERYQEVAVPVGAEWQRVFVGLGGSGRSNCAGTWGPLAQCRSQQSVSSWDLSDPYSCPTGATLLGLPEDAVALATETAAALVTLVDGVVEDVRQTVDPYVAPVLAMVNPILAEAYATVWGTLGVLPVEVATDTAGCTHSVATVDSTTVSRSATGQMPASVCVVNGSRVTRVTIG